MASNYFFKDRSGGQNGPVSLDELVAVAKSGRIAPDCLVWSGGGEPMAASRFPGLAEIFAQRPSAPTPAGKGPLVADFVGWGLIWRGLVFNLGVVLIVTAPWAGRWFYAWIASRLSLPNGAKLRLESRLNAFWYLFVIWGAAALTPALLRGSRPEVDGFAKFVGNICIVVVSYQIIRWFAGSLRSADNSLDVEFTGGIWAYFGWNLLVFLSIFTIIGWAWAVRGMMRWMCRKTIGSHRFEFVASGGQILWRFVAAAFGALAPSGLLYGLGAVVLRQGHAGFAVVLLLLGLAAFVFLFGWALSWLYNWLASQVVVTPDASAPAVQQAA